MFKRNSDAPRHQIAAAAHPIRPFVADPDDVVKAPGSVRRDVRPCAGRIIGSVLETHQVPRRFLGGRLRQKACLGPAKLGRAIRQAGKLPDRVKRDLRIVSARLNRNVAPGARGLELIAIEFRQVDERRRPLGRQAVPVRSVFHEEPGAEAKGDGQPFGCEAKRGPAIRPFYRHVLSQVAGCLSGRHARRGVGPDFQHRLELVAVFGETIESREVAVRLVRRGDAALVRVKERLAEFRFALRDLRRGASESRCAGARQRASRPDEQTATGRPRSLARERAAHFAKTRVLFSSSTK